MFNIHQALTECANGNESAFRFIWSFYHGVHCIDDLIDKDKELQPEYVIRTMWSMLVNFADNEFFQQNKTYLMPVLTAAIHAYIDSERFVKSENVLERVASQVLKSQYADVFFATAYLTGGADHMLTMSRRWRQYHFDPVPKPNESQEEK